MVLLAEGDRAPADVRLIDVSNFAVNESLLTGESVPVVKEPRSTATCLFRAALA
jgi:Ca2+-transporting ATPase